MKYKLFRTTIITLVSVFVLSSCTGSTAASSWPGYSVRDGVTYLSYSAGTYAIDGDNGSPLWAYPPEDDRARQSYAPPAIADDLVVTGDYSGNLVALDKDNGTTEWVFNGTDGRYVASALIEGENVFAPNADHFVYTLDLDGNLLWKFKTGGPNWSKPIVDDGKVFIASMDHNLYALDIEQAPQNLVLADDGTKTELKEVVWTADLGNAIVSNPIRQDGSLFAATIKGELFKVDAIDGKIIWNFDNDGKMAAIWGEPVLIDSVVFVADLDGKVYALDAENGTSLWAAPFEAGSQIVGGGAILDGGVVYATEDGKVFTINSEKEVKTITTLETALQAPVQVDGENIIVANVSKESLLSAIDLNGFKVWSFVPAN